MSPSPDPPPSTATSSPLGRVVRAATQARRRTLRRPLPDTTLPSATPPPTISTTALSRSPPPSPDPDPRPAFFKSPRELRTRLRAIRIPDHDHVARHRHRRRDDLLRTLLSFPEYDAATVAALLDQYDGDQAKVVAKLSQYRRSPPQKHPSTATPLTHAQSPAVDPESNQSRPTQSPPPHHISSLEQNLTPVRTAADQRDVSPLASRPPLPPPTQQPYVSAAPPPLDLGLGGSSSPVHGHGHGHGDALRSRHRVGRYSFPPGPQAGRPAFGDEARIFPFVPSSDASSVASSTDGSPLSAVDEATRKARGLKRPRSAAASSDFGAGFRTPLVSPDSSRTRDEWAPGSDSTSDAGTATLAPESERPDFESQVDRLVVPTPFASEGEMIVDVVDAVVERYQDDIAGPPFEASPPYFGESLRSARTIPERDPGEARMPESEAFRLLLARISTLETAFREYKKESTAVRKELRHRLDMSELERRALEQRHDALIHELDENHKRGVKTEQYLDAMRRDLGKAIGSQQSKLTYIARSTLNNALYYFLAYLVPIFAFLVRGIRDLFGATRRRLARSKLEGDGTVEK